MSLGDLLESLTEQQRDNIKKRPPDVASVPYAQAELDLTDLIIGAYELWSAFRVVFELRRDERFRPLLDAGPAVIQYRIAVRPGEGIESLAARVHAGEHVILPRAVEWFVTGRLRLVGDAVMLDGKRLQQPVIVEGDA